MGAIANQQVDFQLGRLVPQIIESHRAAQEAGQDMLQHMLTCGRRLCEMKEMVKHGEFESSIEREFGESFSLWTARRYMKLFLHWPQLTDVLGEEAAQNLSMEGALKAIESQKPKKIAPPEAVKPKGAQTFDIGQRDDAQPDVCLRGGFHEWKTDDEGEYCGKCQEPADTGEAGGAAGAVMGGGASEAIMATHQRTSAQPFAAADTAFTTLIRAVDQCQQGFAHEKLYGDVLQSLNLAYEDFKLWRKAFRQ